MKSIYDMMGRHTYPILREDAPLEHVERFFQVSARGRGRQKRKEGASALRACCSHGRCNFPSSSGWLKELKPSLCPPSAEPHLRADGLMDSESADTPRPELLPPPATPSPPGASLRGEGVEVTALCPWGLGGPRLHLPLLRALSHSTFPAVCQGDEGGP